MAALNILISISVLSLLSLPHYSSSTQAVCKSHTFTSKKATFENCNDLPTLKAFLHWSYNSSTSTLAMAFTARPPSPSGWTAWALNPKGPGMVGAQALIAHKPNSSGPVSVNPYNLQSYHTITKRSLSYNITGISAEQSPAGEISIFATWEVPNDQSTVNQVWQVGPVINGQIGSHVLGEENLGSMMKLNLVSGPSSFSVAGPTTSTPTGEFRPPLPPQLKSGEGRDLLSWNTIGPSIIFPLAAFILFLL